MNLHSDTNFILKNKKESQTIPRQHEEVKKLENKNFGKVPKYLNKVKEEIDNE